MRVSSTAGRRVHLLGCPLDAVNLNEAVAAVNEVIVRAGRMQHAAVNAAKLVKLQRDAELRNAVASCDLITADGQSVVWAARLLGQRVPERVTGIDLMEALLELADRRGYRVFLLGARPAVVERCAELIRARYRGLELGGYRHGYFKPEEEDSVVAEIADADPQLLFVALETPVKEKFLARHRDRLGVPFTMGVGGALDVMAGVRRRAPRWLQRLGLEWFYRLAQEPRRLAARYVVGNTQFAWLVFRAAVRRAGA